MNFKNKKIGIWGLGVVGTSALNFFSQFTPFLQVINQSPLDSDQQNLLQKHQADLIQYKDLELFLTNNDFILPSPGININQYISDYKNKFITEADIFYHFFKKPIISITGSVGKTTITHLLAQLLQKQDVKAHIGGNVGYPMLQLLNEQNIDLAVLELSSFQLEHCKSFAPDIAILTNFYPNHLDRHGSTQNYFMAKSMLFRFQNNHQKALLPLSLKGLIQTKAQVNYFSSENKAKQAKYTFDHHKIIKTQPTLITLIKDMHTLPPCTFLQNWLIIVATLDLLGKKYKKISDFILPEHRFEKIEANNITFYNDSKSTVPAATLIALNNIKNKNIMLFLGGLSKGIDRSSLVSTIKGKVSEIYCFGKEALSLKKICDQNSITSFQFETLEDAFFSCIKRVKPGDSVLFSPAGSSFDLFDNYIHRGIVFKKLVKNYQSLTAKSK